MLIFKQFLMIAKPYWLSRASVLSWLLFLITIALSLLLVQVMVQLNSWNKAFFDALAALDGPLIYDLLLKFIGIVALVVVMTVYAKWLQQWVELRWRTWLTERFVSRWLSQQNIYHLTLRDEPDNPDQRIAEDIKLLTTDTLSLIIGLVKSVATLSAFSVILWRLSGDFLLPLFDGVQLSGYLLWLALLYSVIGAGVTHFFGHKLHRLFYQQQKREANFRANLLRSRDSAEQIALMKGQQREKAQLDSRFSDIALNWKALMAREKKLGLVVNTYHQIAAMVPYFAAIPALMANVITVGGLFQVKMAFMKVYASLSWFIFRYDDLTRWSATVTRLGQFVEAMERCEHLATDASRPALHQQPGQGIRCQALSILRPDGSALLSELDLQLAAGESMMIQGPSGLGKSTLLRTLAGIWPFYQGEYQVQPAGVLLLPQKPYLPTSTLRSCLSYPHPELADNQPYIKALEAVGLEFLSSKLDEEAEWQARLSGGEQQKLALARAFVVQPETLILDEATSNLDEPTAYLLIKKLRDTLPNSVILMVSHQRHLAPLFQKTLDLTPQFEEPVRPTRQTVDTPVFA
ncbi:MULTISPECIES: ABC transporter ATP-binding protein/permease [Vibrio]|uniref:ABC transporter ATP-binding protein/permease n=1 Tax=Vibrio TaxID=662 RepID=UPI000C162B1F|nr:MULTISPECIES: ABC transporter ATP-binding protein/permease [Vibrio]NNN44542.1 ABC transporter ATP-binding protein/permease [Vibrio sp. 1-1(7)]NNN73058.1 ABC transporter ATP-binding protein/permease [Vibrio sp. 12-2(3-a)]